MSERKLGLFSKIQSRDDALKVVKDTSTVFFVIAVLQAAFAFLVGVAILFDAAVYAIGGFFLRRFKSRAAATVLLLLATVGMGVTIVNRTGRTLGGGRNVILALILLWAAIRAVQATFMLRSRFSQELASGQPERRGE